MFRRVALAGALIASASCNRSEGGDSAGAVPVASAGSAKAAGPGGSFSTDLAKELAGTGSAGEGRSGSAASGDPRVGAGASGSASSDPRASGDKAGGDKAGGVAPAAAPADDQAGGGAKPASADTASAGKAGGDKAGGDKAGGDKAGGDKAGGDKAGGDKMGGVAPAAVPAGDKTGGGAKPAGADPAAASKASGGAPAATPADIVGAPARGPVKVPAELAAIKLSLLPNWDRDLGQAGTFQYVVRIKGTQSTKTFAFHYGYDEPRAPKDHEQYKKYLQDTGALTGELRDRQRGAAWFLEGNDAAGNPAFRYVVLYGGKQLICYGSLYKDADSSRLGDDRDQTLIQAKQICETLAL
jgi:hypothetical protein